MSGGLAPLRAAGVRFAIDDTGAGYASLSHVLRLRPDIIKLDRDLICGPDPRVPRWARGPAPQSVVIPAAALSEAGLVA